MLRDYQNELIVKTKEAYKQGFNRPCIVLPCGGGKSLITAVMAKSATDKGSRVLFIVHRQELCEQIEETFKRVGVDMNLCTVGMVQTISRRLKTTPEPKLIIVDENHHSVANTYKKILDYFNKVKCVGVTATPTRLNGGGLGEVNDKLIIGVSAKWLIENGYLAPYKYYAPPTIKADNFRIKMGEFVIDENEMDKSTIYGDVIGHYKKLADGKQAICYCSTLSLSKRTAQAFNDAGILSVHIDGETPKTERKEAVEAFRQGKIKILCNVDLISEGFDVPDCDCAILLRPTKSLNLFIQQSMRCMRYKPGKEAVIIDHVGNVFRHGFPDDDRVWSLESKKKGKKEENSVFVKQCPQCFFTYSKEIICPNCGYKIEKTQSEIRYDKEVKLKEIKSLDAEVVKEYTDIDQCKNMSQAVEWCKQHGKKPGYAYYAFGKGKYNIKFGR